MTHEPRTISQWPFLYVFLVLLIAAPVSATNIAWRFSSSGSWNVPANWLPAQVPGPGDVAIIAQAGTYDVTINSNVSVGAINLGSSGSPRLHVNSATLTMGTGVAIGSS